MVGALKESITKTSITNSMNKLFNTILLPTAFAVVLCAAVPSASASQQRTRSRTGTFQDSNGNSGTSTSSTTRSPGSRQHAATWTNQNGQTGSHNSDYTWNKTTETGTFSSSTTLTNGKTESRQGTITETAPDNYQIQGTKTGLNGKTSTFDLDKTKSATGSTTTGSITGANGGVSTLNSVTTKNDNGYAKDTTITGPKGGQTKIDTTLTKSPGETLKNTEVTGPKGKTEDRVVDTKYNPDGSGTRTVENTGPDGKTYTRTENFSAPITTTISSPTS
jgi:hypothetical protein